MRNKNRSFWGKSVAVLAALLVLGMASCPAERPLYTADDVEIIGHRGAPRSAPENTISAFEAAAVQGADALEVDLCVTRDDVVILWHDCDPDDAIAVARQAGAEGLPYVPTAPLVGDAMRRPIWELTFDEVQANYGYEGLDPFEDTPENLIPTMEQFFDWWAEHPAIGAVYLDSKLPLGQEDEARRVVRRIREGLEQRPALQQKDRVVYLLSVHRKHVELYLEELQGAPGETIVVWDHEEEQGALENLESLGLRHASLGMGFEPLWEFPDFQREVQRLLDARQEGRLDRVVVWTFDDVDKIEALIEMGVDGIMTNRPDLIRNGSP